MPRISVEAVYEDGILRLKEHLPVENGTSVTVNVLVGPSRAEQSYGLMGWTGDAETLRRIADDPELGG